MNVRLLRRIQKAILEEPKRVAMNVWAVGGDAIQFGEYKSEFGSGVDLCKRSDVPACGTIGCICGWGFALTTKLRGNALADMMDKLWRSGGVTPAGSAKLFGLTEEQAKCLFFRDCWPDEFSNKLDRLYFGTKRYARVVCDRIDHFIATKGAE